MALLARGSSLGTCRVTVSDTLNGCYVIYALGLKRWRHWGGEQSIVERFAVTLDIKRG